MVEPTSGPPDPRGTGAAGQLLAGRYRLVRPIASGGMARVWEATDETLSRPVAVKVLHGHLAADDSFVARFRAEAVNAARLSHPSIVSVYDTWTGDGIEVIVMELVRGSTLRQLLDRRGRLDPDDSIVVGAQIAAALDHAHAAGIIHRDVKPANVLLSNEGRVLVTDFGIAKATEGADLTTEHAMLGTAKYLAPEQVEGERIDARADLYSLGVVLYEMLAGRAPFVADSEAATALARLHRLPEPLRWVRPELSPSLEEVVRRCLARRPQDRFPDAVSTRAALMAADPTLDASRPVDRSADLSIGGGPGQAGAGFGPAPRQHSTAPHHQPAAPVAPAAPPDPSGWDADDWDGEAVPARRRRRRFGGIVVAGLVGTAVVVLVLLAQALNPGGLVGRDPAAAAAIANVAAFDPPPGDRNEHNAEAGLAFDGDPESAWTTEHYRNPDIAAFKGGVGLVVTLKESAKVGEVKVSSSSQGWSASVFRVDAGGAAPADINGWGQAIESTQNIAGDVTFAVDRRATAILIWITRTAPDGQVSIRNISVG